jgi:hypothetical protein
VRRDLRRLACAAFPETISHEKDAWLVLENDEGQDLRRAIPELVLEKERPLQADWEVKATISTEVPDEHTGRRVGREIRALASAVRNASAPGKSPEGRRSNTSRSFAESGRPQAMTGTVGKGRA